MFLIGFMVDVPLTEELETFGIIGLLTVGRWFPRVKVFLFADLGRVQFPNQFRGPKDR